MAAKTTVKWYGEKVKKKIRTELVHRLYKVAKLYVRTAKRGLRRKLNWGGKNPSLPGRYPARVTGHLARSVKSKVNRKRLKMSWGSTSIIGKFMQLGTRLMKRRPWMTLTNRRCVRRVVRILGNTMRGGR